MKRLNQERKSRLIRESKDDKELLTKILAKLPVDKDLVNLLKKHGDLSFLKNLGNQQLEAHNKGKKEEDEKVPAKKRFPSFFKLNLQSNGDGKPLKTIPLNDKGIVTFKTDVENEYLLRPQDRGELKVEVLQDKRNGEVPTPDPNPFPNDGEEIITVEREGPTNGTIKLHINPKNAQVGDEVEIKTILSAPGQDFECFFWVKVTDPRKETTRRRKKKSDDFPQLPHPIKVFKDKNEEGKTWDDYKWSGHNIVKIIEGGQNKLVEGIAVNMDSFALEQFLSKNQLKTKNKINPAKDTYFTSVYLHTLFLYGILDKVSKSEEDESLKDVDFAELIPLLMRPYSSFLLYQTYGINKESFHTIDDEE